MDNKDSIEDIKKKVHSSSLHLSDVPKNTKNEFLDLAHAEFKGHYGFTLKWLMDFRKGLLTDPNEELLGRIDSTDVKVAYLNDEIIKMWNKEDDKKPTGKRLLSGRILNEVNKE